MSCIPKVEIKQCYLKDWDIHFYIVYSECGRFSETFYDPTSAIEFASKEYQSRMESAKFKQMLEDRI